MDTENTGYLIITRRPGERVHIGEHIIEIISTAAHVCKFRIIAPPHTFYLPPGSDIRLFGSVRLYLIALRPGKAKIGIEAPSNIKILREELVAKGKIS